MIADLERCVRQPIPAARIVRAAEGGRVVVVTPVLGPALRPAGAGRRVELRVVSQPPGHCKVARTRAVRGATRACTEQRIFKLGLRTLVAAAFSNKPWRNEN